MLRRWQVADIKYCLPKPKSIAKMKKMKLKTYLSYATLVIGIFALGSTLASDINLNSNTAVEFGQGVAQTTACTGNESLVVTPLSNFDNSASTFSLTDITISNIPDNCIGKDFRISLYSNTSVLDLDVGVTIARIQYSGEDTNLVYRGTSGIDTFGATVTNVSAVDGYGTFTLHLTGSKPAADQVQTITIESAPGSCKGVLENNPGDSAYQIHQDCPTLPSGLYWIQNSNIDSGNPVQIFADMTRNGGGWTLVVANGVSGWTAGETLLVNGDNPPSDPEILTDQGDKYSILSWADYIKRSASGFDYRIEADELGSWGATFTANGAYSFVSTSNSNTDVTRNEIFDSWDYSNGGLEERMPWYDPLGNGTLTTSTSSTEMWWGTLIASNPHCGSLPAPYLETSISCPSKIWYWVR